MSNTCKKKEIFLLRILSFSSAEKLTFIMHGMIMNCSFYKNPMSVNFICFNILNLSMHLHLLKYYIFAQKTISLFQAFRLTKVL
jgi:hypothetical protein